MNALARTLLPLSLSLSLSLLSAAAQAQVQVTDAWVRATVAQQKATGAYMQLKSPKAMRLVEARSSVAGVTEVHEMVMEGSTMKMRALPSLALPAGETVALKPGGLHVMLMDLKRPVSAGDTVPLTLVFEDAKQQRQTLELQVPAKPMGTAAPQQHSGHAHGGHGGHSGH